MGKNKEQEKEKEKQKEQEKERTARNLPKEAAKAEKNWRHIKNMWKGRAGKPVLTGLRPQDIVDAKHVQAAWPFAGLLLSLAFFDLSALFPFVAARRPVGVRDLPWGAAEELKRAPLGMVPRRVPKKVRFIKQIGMY